MKKVLLILICLFWSSNVFAYYSSDAIDNGGYVMPDLYNTGSLTPKEELIEFSDKYPDITCADFCRIGPKQAEKYGYVFEGFKTNKRVLINGASNVILKDFYIDTQDSYGIQLTDWNNIGTPTNIIIEDGEIVGTKSAAIIGKNVEIRRVYIHEYGGDAIKISSNQLIESNYIASGGLNKGAHADGVQLTGVSNDIKIYGNRFDMIGTFDDYKANATLFLQLEKEQANNVEVSYNWLNGGGYTIYVNEYEEGKFTGIKFLNNIIGNGRRFGYYASNMTAAAKEKIVGLDSFIYAEDENVPFIGSVLYKSNNQTITDLKDVKDNLNIIVNAANYNSNEQDIVLMAKLYNYKGELVKTYQQKNKIMRNMPGREYITDKGVVLKQVSMDDFPQNVETTLSITDLPTDISGYSIKVEVYKSGNLNDTLRTSKIVNSNKKEYLLKDIEVEGAVLDYIEGDKFSIDGLKVFALYIDGTRKEVYDYFISNVEKLNLDDSKIIISYTEDGITVKEILDIVVNDNNIDQVIKPDNNLDDKVDNNDNLYEEPIVDNDKVNNKTENSNKVDETTDSDTNIDNDNNNTTNDSDVNKDSNIITNNSSDNASVNDENNIIENNSDIVTNGTVISNPKYVSIILIAFGVALGFIILILKNRK